MTTPTPVRVPNSAELQEVLAAALEVAAAPPLAQHETTFSALVPWHKVRRLREAVEAAGYDWRRYK